MNVAAQPNGSIESSVLVFLDDWDEYPSRSRHNLPHIACQHCALCFNTIGMRTMPDRLRGQSKKNSSDTDPRTDCSKHRLATIIPDPRGAKTEQFCSAVRMSLAENSLVWLYQSQLPGLVRASEMLRLAR